MPANNPINEVIDKIERKTAGILLGCRKILCLKDYHNGMPNN
jgi:hypothetical protein